MLRWLLGEVLISAPLCSTRWWMSVRTSVWLGGANEAGMGEMCNKNRQLGVAASPVSDLLADSSYYSHVQPGTPSSCGVAGEGMQADPSKGSTLAKASLQLWQQR